MKYPGITTDILKNGSKNIYVRFKYKGRNYNKLNFTKLYGITNEAEAFSELQVMKKEIAKGKDPFNMTSEILNDIFDERLKQKVANGDWTHSTPTNYTYFYNAYIRDTVGHKNVAKITYEDLLNIQNSMTNVVNSTKNTLKMILRPIFAEQVKLKRIYENPVDELKTYNMPVKEKLKHRIVENHLDVVSKLYNAIPKYKTKSDKQSAEIHTFLFLVLLSAHRFGELLRLQKDDCYMKIQKIISPKSITKTKEDYHFPIPDECLEYINSIESGLLFPSVKRGSLYQIFQRVVALAEIELYRDKKISLHDTRRFMLTIMIRNLNIDSVLADTCLDHKQRGTIKHYIDLEYEDIEEAYKKYWKLIRSEANLSN